MRRAWRLNRGDPDVRLARRLRRGYPCEVRLRGLQKSTEVDYTLAVAH